MALWSKYLGDIHSHRALNTQLFKLVSVLSAEVIWTVNPQCIRLTCMAKPAITESHNV